MDVEIMLDPEKHGYEECKHCKFVVIESGVHDQAIYYEKRNYTPTELRELAKIRRRARA